MATKSDSESGPAESEPTESGPTPLDQIEIPVPLVKSEISEM